MSNTIKLNNRVDIPMLGFGAWQVKNDQNTVTIINHATDCGYRHIVTAAFLGVNPLSVKF